MEKINVEAIFKDNDFFINESLTYDEKAKIKSAIKELLESVIDRCAQEAEIEDLADYSVSYEVQPMPVVDKQSILSIKDQIEY